MSDRLSELGVMNASVSYALARLREYTIHKMAQKDRRIYVLELALERIRNELGVPHEETPAPIANAYEIASEALVDEGRDHGRHDPSPTLEEADAWVARLRDGFARHGWSDAHEGRGS